MNEEITLLIDGDPIAFNSAVYALAGGRDPAPDAASQVDKLMTKLGAGRAIVAVSDASRRYFRHDWDPQYKSNRKPPPDNIARARKGLACTFRDGRRSVVKELHGFEADDLIGVLATGDSVKGRRIIVADDKHLLTIPGEHHRPKTYRGNTVMTVSESEAGCLHLQQTLEAYCDRVGETGAKKIITLRDYAASPAAAWKTVVKTFIEHGHSEADALTAARVCRICRASEFNFETLDVVAWVPPTETPPTRRPPEPDPAVAGVDPRKLFPDDGPRQNWM